MTTIGADIDTDVLEALDFQESPPQCDYIGCDEVATHTLVCGICGQGREFMCSPHTEVTAAAKMEVPYERIVFSETCGHTPFFETCEITPL